MRHESKVRIDMTKTQMPQNTNYFVFSCMGIKLMSLEVSNTINDDYTQKLTKQISNDLSNNPTIKDGRQ